MGIGRDIADSFDGRVRDASIIEISNAFDLFPLDRLLTKLAAWGVDLRVVFSVGNCLWVVHRGSD